MKLSVQGLQDPAYAQKGYRLPGYDLLAMGERTLASTPWLHFGAGNLFRAFPAVAQQRLLQQREAGYGVVVCEGYDETLLQQAYTPFDNLSLLVVLKGDGSIEKEVVGSVAAAWQAQTEHEDWQRIKEAFERPSLQMVSFTITEKGYGKEAPAVQADREGGPRAPRSLMGKVTALLLARFMAGAPPLALVSMDNCSHNGDILRGAVWAMAAGWAKAGHAPQGFLDYVQDGSRVSFPCTMIDKITPRPDSQVRRLLEADGFEDAGLIVTPQGTYTAAFVNAEETEYLVVEDHFPNGRPPLEKAGILFCDRATVDKAERMKVCTCLNPLHTALAVFGCLLGFDTIAREMRDGDLRAMVERLGYREGLPVASDPVVLNPRAFLETVLTQRLPNPFLPDTPQRIATDTSQKLAIRFGETIKAYRQNPALNEEELVVIPLVFGAWLRYLTGIDDGGQAFQPSPDPLLEALQGAVASLHLGEAVDREALRPLLCRTDLFGVDLLATGMGERVLDALEKMQAGPGAVRRTLQEALAGVAA